MTLRVELKAAESQTSNCQSFEKAETATADVIKSTAETTSSESQIAASRSAENENTPREASNSRKSRLKKIRVIAQDLAVCALPSRES
jgi:hypothetical protein